MSSKTSSKAKRLMATLERFAGTLILIILSFAFFTRVYRLHIPEDYMFDEVYHAVTIKLIANNDPRAYEWWNEAPEPDTAVDWLHPPTAKLIQAGGVLMFGANSFGWRIASAVAGVLLVLATYFLSRSLFKNVLIALVAAILVSLDGLLLVQSRIAMNDIFVTLFVILSLWQYWQYRHHSQQKSIWLAGICVGLAISSKWSGIYALGAIGFFELLAASAAVSTAASSASKNKLASFKNWKKWIQQVGFSLLAFLFIPIIIYLLSYSQMWLQGKDWAHFTELNRQIFYYQTHLDATHPYQSTPMEWALNTRPVWYYVDYSNQPKSFIFHNFDKWRADIYASGNTPLYWMGLIAVASSVGWFVREISQVKPKGKNNQQFLSKLSAWLRYSSNSEQLFLLLAYTVMWVPWIFSPRIMFFYHYAPAVPLMCILLSFWMVKLAQNKHQYVRYLIFAAAISIGLYFFIWYPHWTGMMMPSAIKEHIYFALPNWK